MVTAVSGAISSPFAMISPGVVGERRLHQQQKDGSADEQHEDDRVPGTNLTREEAQQRANLGGIRGRAP
jgi:hypothetical protein